MSGEAPPIWRERTLVVFMLAALGSNIGNWMQIFSEQWLTLLLSGPEAARWGGRLGFASGLAILVFVPLGGLLADRVERRRALALAQAWLMGLAAVMGLLAWRGKLGLHGLLAFALASGLGSAFSMPLAQSLIGDLVAPERIPAAMGVMSIQFNLSRILGPALAAFLFPFVGASGNFLLNALTFLPLIGVCHRMRPAHSPRRSDAGGTYREGWAAFRSNPDMSSLLVLAVISGLFAWSYFALLPVYGARHLHLGERGVAGLLASFGVGAVLGALGVTRDRQGRDKRPRLFWGYGLFGVGLILLGVLTHPWAAVGVFFILGVAQATFLTLMSGLVQQGAPPELRGRVNGIFLTAILGITPLGNLLAGEAAQALGHYGPRWVLGADGLVLLAAALITYGTTPKPRGASDEFPMEPGGPSGAH